MKRGFFIVAELTGPSRDAVLEVQRWADPKLAKDTTPHITLVGSSGVGPIHRIHLLTNCVTSSRLRPHKHRHSC